MKTGRILLLVAGGVSVVLGLWHFGTRRGVEEVVRRANADLVALSMLFAGLVTVTLALMAISRMLLGGYAGLFAAYYLGHAIVLLYVNSLLRGVASIVLAALALVAAYWILTSKGEGVPSNPPPPPAEGGS